VRRTEPGTLILRDEHYWIPLIGLFSGMRQEEICQLHVEDVREAWGINSRPPRKLKNATAARLVPVHKDLIAPARFITARTTVPLPVGSSQRMT
jgi:integrase